MKGLACTACMLLGNLLLPVCGLGQELVAPRVAPEAGDVYTTPPPVPAASAIRSEILAATTASQTYAGDGYDLDELLALAAANNPTLRQASLHISAELGKALQAGLYPNPTFAYEAEQIFIDVPGDKDSPGEFQGGVISQRIVTAGKLRLSREKYLRRAHLAEHQAMAQQFRVFNDVRIHFFRALAAQQSLEIRRELLKTAEDQAVTEQEAYNLGQARRSEVRRANVRLQRTRLEVLSAENAFGEQLRALTSLVGVEVPVSSLEGELSSTSPPISFEQALYRLLTDSPELAAARAKLAVDRSTVRRESVEWVPDVVVRGGSGYNFEAKETTAVAGVSIEVPLYDRNQGTVQQARSDYSRQRSEVERVELELRSRLASTFQRYATALQHVDQYEQYILPELKAAYAELLQSYKENRVRWPDVLMAQQEYFDARLAQVDNLVTARTQEVLFYGFLLHDGLMAAPGIAPPGHIDAVPQPR